MPMEKIIERIQEEMQDKVDNIIQRGKEKSEEVRKEIEKDKERRLDKIEKEKEREIKTMKNRIISQAKLDSKKKELNVREEKINEVFEKVKTRLDSRDPEEYEGYIKHSIKRADEVLGGSIKIRCDPETEDLVKRYIEDINPEMKVEPELDTIGGIKASSEEGSSIDFTFEANLERKRKELRKEISEILFQKEEVD